MPWCCRGPRPTTNWDKGTLMTADNLCTAARNLGINRAELLTRYRFIDPEEVAALADEIRGHSHRPMRRLERRRRTDVAVSPTETTPTSSTCPRAGTRLRPSPRTYERCSCGSDRPHRHHTGIHFVEPVDTTPHVALPVGSGCHAQPRVAGMRRRADVAVGLRHPWVPHHLTGEWELENSHRARLLHRRGVGDRLPGNALAAASATTPPSRRRSSSMWSRRRCCVFRRARPRSRSARAAGSGTGALIFLELHTTSG